MTPYNLALELITGCDSIETNLARAKTFFVGGELTQIMSGGRLPTRIVFGTFKGAVRRGRVGKGKEWADYV